MSGNSCTRDDWNGVLLYQSYAPVHYQVLKTRALVSVFVVVLYVLMYFWVPYVSFCFVLFFSPLDYACPPSYVLSVCLSVVLVAYSFFFLFLFVCVCCRWRVITILVKDVFVSFVMHARTLVLFG